MIRYEDLVSDPQQIIRSTTSLIDGNELDIDGLDNSSVTLGKSHVVAGNPNRFAVGPMKIAEDNNLAVYFVSKDVTGGKDAYITVHSNAFKDALASN